MERPNLVPRREQRARALIKPRSEPGGLAVDGDPTGRHQAEPTRGDGITGRQRRTKRCQDEGLEKTGDGGNAAETPATPGGEARPVVGTCRNGWTLPFHPEGGGSSRNH